MPLGLERSLYVLGARGAGFKTIVSLGSRCSLLLLSVGGRLPLPGIWSFDDLGRPGSVDARCCVSGVDAAVLWEKDCLFAVIVVGFGVGWEAGRAGAEPFIDCCDGRAVAGV